HAGPARRDVRLPTGYRLLAVRRLRQPWPAHCRLDRPACVAAGILPLRDDGRRRRLQACAPHGRKPGALAVAGPAQLAITSAQGLASAAQAGASMKAILRWRSLDELDAADLQAWAELGGRAEPHSN